MSLGSTRDHDMTVHENGGIDGTDEDGSCLIVTGTYLIGDANGNDGTFRKCDGIRGIR